MVLGRGGVLILLGLSVAGAELTACGGKSDGHDSRLATGGTGGALGTGGSAVTGCELDGMHLDVGESFGACNECTCDENGEVSCALILCAAGTGGTTGTGGDSGTGNSGGTGNATGTGGAAVAGSGALSAGGEGGMSTGAAGGTSPTAGRAAGGAASGRGGASGRAGASGRGGAGGQGGASARGGSGGQGGSSAGTLASGGMFGGPNCGNGMLDIGEGCDDANTAPGDGCSAVCTIESGFGCDGSSPTKCRRPYYSCSGTNGNECQGRDCCAGSSVPGGTFAEGLGTAVSFSSKVSPFLLDDYEVTVARFRMFVSSYDFWRANNNPKAGSGANPNVATSGWKASWNGNLPADSTALVASLKCDYAYQTFAESGHDTLPINCVTWFLAFAFCTWDEGRLPTEAEWEYAARGGISEFVYPWGDTPVPTNAQDSTATYASYDCLGDGSAPGACALTDILPVGSRPAGKGFYGQYDLAGSLWEWTLDEYAAYPTSESTDYAKTTDGSDRSIRGGDWYRDASTLAGSYRGINARETPSIHVGFRCARAP